MANNNQELTVQGHDFKLIPFNNFDKLKYNQLMPASLEELSPYHSVRYFQVEISPDPRDGDVYQESGQLALRKRALDMLSDAAGIVWDTRNCRRIDNLKDDDLVIFQVVGGIRRPDGTVKAVTGTKEINLRDLERTSKEDIAAGGKGMSVKELGQIRKHKTRLAETKAYLAAMRSLMKIKSTYTEAELRKPFVVAQVFVDPTKDPEIARALRARVVQDVRELFGPGAEEHLTPPKQLPTPEVESGEFTEDAEDAELFAPAPSEKQIVEDLRNRIVELARGQGLTKGKIEELSQKHGGHSYAELTLDGLVALAEALAAKG